MQIVDDRPSPYTQMQSLGHPSERSKDIRITETSTLEKELLPGDVSIPAVEKRGSDLSCNNAARTCTKVSSAALPTSLTTLDRAQLNQYSMTNERVGPAMTMLKRG